MAENFAYTPGTGGTGAADDIAGVKYPQVKLTDGTADSTTGIYVDIGAKANALRVAPANDITDGTYIGDIKFGEALATVTTVTTVSTVTNLSQMGGQAINMGEGVLAAGTQRVTLATDDDAVAHLATIAGDTINIETAIQLLDNAVDGNYLNVNLNMAGTDAAAGEGTISAQTQRVTIATDDDGVAHLATIAGDTTSIDGKITTCNTGAVVLATGTASVGKLAANDGVDIGDVDVTSITNIHSADYDSGAGTDTTLAIGIAVPADGGAAVVPGDSTNGLLVNLGTNNDITIAAAQTLATVTTVGTVTTITNVVHVDDNAGSLTIDGTVTAELSATDNAVLDTIDTVLDTINTKLVTGTVIGDVNLGATDNAVLDAIAASLVTIDSDTNDIKTATEKIDDWDATHDSVASADGPQLMAVYDSTKPTAVGDGDAIRVLADAYGRLLAGVEPERFQTTITSADATSATQVKAKTADKKMYILYLDVSTDTAMNIQFQDDAGTPNVLKEQQYFAANGGAVMTFPPQAPLVVTTNQDFDVIVSKAGNISVTITGYLAV